MSRHAEPSIPVFKLYGGQQEWPNLDLLHCETISQRSRLHHWEIQPHRHADLYQLLYVHRGQALIDVEGRRQTLVQPGVQWVPPLFVHGFQFSEQVEGYVLTLAAPLVGQLQAHWGPTANALAAPALCLAGRERGHLFRLFSMLQQEYLGTQPGREELLRSLVGVAMAWLNRQVQQRRAANQPAERGHDYFARYTRLVEAHYRQHWSVERLAHQVGISVAHLNSVCRQSAGQTALQLLHQRLLLEAKRNLIYTSMSVTQLAESLGFSDPAYFARFFRRLAGTTPREFRQAQPQGLAEPVEGRIVGQA